MDLGWSVAGSADLSAQSPLEYPASLALPRTPKQHTKERTQRSTLLSAVSEAADRTRYACERGALDWGTPLASLQSCRQAVSPVGDDLSGNSRLHAENGWPHLLHASCISHAFCGGRSRSRELAGRPMAALAQAHLCSRCNRNGSYRSAHGSARSSCSSVHPLYGCDAHDAAPY